MTKKQKIHWNRVPHNSIVSWDFGVWSVCKKYNVGGTQVDKQYLKEQRLADCNSYIEEL